MCMFHWSIQMLRYSIDITLIYGMCFIYITGDSLSYIYNIYIYIIYIYIYIYSYVWVETRYILWYIYNYIYTSLYIIDMSLIYDMTLYYSIDQVNSLREIQAMRKLSPHPNILQLYEVLLWVWFQFPSLYFLMWGIPSYCPM